MKDLSPEARTVLEAGLHGDDPAPADRERLRGMVKGAIATGVVASAAVVAAPATAGAGAIGGTVVKVLVGVVIVGAAGSATVAELHRRHAGRTSVVADAAAPALATPPENEPTAPVIETPITQSAKHPSPAPAKRAPTITDGHEDAETLEAETADLRDIQEALRARDPRRALTLLDAQAKLYPRGKLGEERDAARIIALCDLHETEQARAALARFERAHPRSPLLDRVRTACATVQER